MHRGPDVLAILTSACASDPPAPSRPRAGDIWEIDAVDHTGVFGTISITRGEVILLPRAATVQPNVRDPGPRSLAAMR